LHLHLPTMRSESAHFQPQRQRVWTRKLPKRASKRRSTHGKSRSVVPAPLRHSRATRNWVGT
jgi:hypothetical protein